MKPRRPGEWTGGADWETVATRAEIDLDAYQHNVRALKAWVGDSVEVAVAVKANAYGHGAVPLSAAALEAGASHLAVATVDEGVQLRRGGIVAPILVMGSLEPSQAAAVVGANLTPTITCESHAVALAAASVSQGVRTPVHLKVDTGMHRNGAEPTAAPVLASIVQGLPSLELEGLYTHMACADDHSERGRRCTQRQFEVFLAARAELLAMGLEVPVSHVANSAATLSQPEMHLDMVRCGIATYGLYGSEDVPRSVELRPVMALKSRIARVHDLRPSDGVSYGHDFVARGRTTVALLPIGYGDGYRRCLSARAEVLVRGRRARIAGRICMDQLVLDVSDIEDVRVGDEAVLIGQQGSETITVAELAHLAETIEYEITTSLGSRVARVYLRGGRAVGLSTLNETIPQLRNGDEK